MVTPAEEEAVTVTVASQTPVALSTSTASVLFCVMAALVILTGFCGRELLPWPSFSVGVPATPVSVSKPRSNWPKRLYLKSRSVRSPASVMKNCEPLVPLFAVTGMTLAEPVVLRL